MAACRADQAFNSGGVCPRWMRQATSTAIYDGDEWTVSTDSQNKKIIVTLRPNASIALASRTTVERHRENISTLDGKLRTIESLAESCRHKYAGARARLREKLGKAGQPATDDDIPQSVTEQEQKELAALAAQRENLESERECEVAAAKAAYVEEGETRVFVLDMDPGALFVDIGPLLRES